MRCASTTIIDPIGDLHQPLAAQLRGGADEVHCVTSLRDLNGALGQSTALLFLPAELLAYLHPRRHKLVPHGRIMPWIRSMERRAFENAEQIEGVDGILAWPETSRSPRGWELALACARAKGMTQPFDPGRAVPGCERQAWKVRSTTDLRDSVQRIGDALRAKAFKPRVVTRVTGVAHEMLMNALYDAPVDRKGRHIYAQDRAADVKVSREDTVKVTFYLGQTSCFLQVEDRFGLLRREHVYKSLRRGFRGRDADAHAKDIIDSSHGGAGLGLHRTVNGASATIFEVIPGKSTLVTTFFDLQQSNRDARTGPKSLHFFGVPFYSDSP